MPFFPLWSKRLLFWIHHVRNNISSPWFMAWTVEQQGKLEGMLLNFVYWWIYPPQWLHVTAGSMKIQNAFQSNKIIKYKNKVPLLQNTWGCSSIGKFCEYFNGCTLLSGETSNDKIVACMQFPTFNFGLSSMWATMCSSQRSNVDLLEQVSISNAVKLGDVALWTTKSLYKEEKFSLEMSISCFINCNFFPIVLYRARTKRFNLRNYCRPL